MTVKELRAKAKEMGLTGFWKMRKAELEKFIEDNTLHNSTALFTGECSGDGEWLEYRKIGATDTSILVVSNAYKQGFIDEPDKYNSPFLMYMERKGLYKRDVSFTSKVAMDFGHYAEDFIISFIPELFEREYGIKVEATKKGDQVVWNKDFPLWTCTPDSWVKIDGKWYPVELKTGNSFTKYQWEREEVPNKYFAQVQQQLAVLGKDKGFLIGFVDNRFTRIYEIHRDDKLIELAYDLTKEFDYQVANNIEPELVGNQLECDFLKQEFKGFKNRYKEIPTITIKSSAMLDFFAMEETKKQINREAKNIDKELDVLRAQIQNEMLKIESDQLVINGEYIANWKIDARGYKRFTLKELPEDKKFEVA